ncbi:MAG TPA: hypothetical protein VFL71_14980 [Actinomycetes bacterium]|nr:hypothetical protein [Actinomycetes bacterium]
MAWARRHVGALVGGALALLALGPLLGRGYVLTYDMVFVPRLELTRGLLGLDTAVPRAVPADLLVALASRLIPADLVQKLLLAGVMVGAAAGAARLVPSPVTAARAAAAALYAWNPFLYERLVMGHWGLLVSYAALPWAAAAAVDLRAAHAAPAATGAPSAPVRRLVAALAVAAFGNPAGGVVAAGVALCVAAAPPWQGGLAALRRAGVVVAAALVVNLPWLVPSVLRPGGVPVRPEGAAAFASRPDGPLGTVGSLVGLGGIWNARAVPPGLGSWPWLAGFAVVLAVAGAGLPLLLRRLERGAAVGLLLAAGLGLVVAAAYAVPGLRALVDLAVGRLPGGGLLRDAQKFVAPLAVVEAVAFGLGAERLLAAPWGGSVERAARLRRLVAAGLVAAPVLLLPALAWGAAGRLAAVGYPPAFTAARAAMAADPVPGAVLVLPWHLYMAHPWNGDRVLLDPAQRWFTRRAVGNDDLELAGLTVPGEDPYSARLGPLARSSAPLGPELPAAGIRYVLLFRAGDWPTQLPRLAGLAPVVDHPELALYRAPERPARVRFATPPVAPVLVADLLAAAVVLWAWTGLSLPARPSRLVSSDRHSEGGHV